MYFQGMIFLKKYLAFPPLSSSWLEILFISFNGKTPLSLLFLLTRALRFSQCNKITSGMGRHLKLDVCSVWGEFPDSVGIFGLSSGHGQNPPLIFKVEMGGAIFRPWKECVAEKNIYHLLNIFIFNLVASGPVLLFLNRNHRALYLFHWV